MPRSHGPSARFDRTECTNPSHHSQPERVSHTPSSPETVHTLTLEVAP
jgi:hypothetical protein